MAIVVVGGNGKDVGKTSVVCAIVAALPEFDWTAVKITGHDYDPTASADGQTLDRTVWEESRAGDDTDTAKYLAAGARRALLVTRHRADVPIVEITWALGSACNVIYESNRIVDVVRPDVCIAVVGGAERKASFVRLLGVANAIVTVGGTEANDLPAGVPHFEHETPDLLSAEMLSWLRGLLRSTKPAARNQA